MQSHCLGVEKKYVLEVMYKCPICKSELEDVEVALQRNWLNALAFAFGSSVLQIRRQQKNEKWETYMTQWRNAKGLHCKECKALVVAPTKTAKEP